MELFEVFIVDDFVGGVCATVEVNSSHVSHAPIHRLTVVQHPGNFLFQGALLIRWQHAFLLAQTGPVVRALSASSILLFAFVPVERAAFELTWFERVRFQLAVLETSVPAAVATVVIALGLVVLAVASAIADPDVNANDRLGSWEGWDDYLRNDASVVITIVNDWRLRKQCIRENLDVSAECKPIAARKLKKQN